MGDSLGVWLGTRGSRLAQLRFGPAVAFSCLDERFVITSPSSGRSTRRRILARP